MRKVLLLALPLLFLFLIPQTKALIYLNDTFTRSSPLPWGCYFTCGTCSIVSSSLYITQANSSCEGYAAFDSATLLENFSISFDYKQQTNNQFILEWNDGSNSRYIIFDTNNNLIEFGNVLSLTDYPSYTNVFYTYPWEFSFGDGTWHNIRMEKVGTSSDTNLKLYIDESKIFDQYSSSFDVDWKNMGLGLYSTDSNHAYYDNIVVESYAPIKLYPELAVHIYPFDPVAYGTDVNVYCTPAPPDLIVHLFYFSTEVSNPYRSSTLPVGENLFNCKSDETDVYYAGSNSNVLTITTATTTTTPLPVEPIPAIDTAEWTAAGYGWALVFFSPMFLATIFMAFICAICAKLGGATFSGIMALVFVAIYSLPQVNIYPSWLGVVLIIIGAFVIAKWGGEVFGGK
jgi:hypothetical protein